MALVATRLSLWRTMGSPGGLSRGISPQLGLLGAGLRRFSEPAGEAVGSDTGGNAKVGEFRMGRRPAPVAVVVGKRPQGVGKVGTAPDAPPITDQELKRLHDFVLRSERLLVITGAGASTESGIPDYRSPSGAYSYGYKPMTHQDFCRTDANRQRYWARSFLGWRRFVDARPGATHQALARMESRGRVASIITQNVDRLHHQAGSNPVELHGTTHTVVCLNCGDLSDRHAFQEKLRELNPEWADMTQWTAAHPAGEAELGEEFLKRPDGDVELGADLLAQIGFHVPPCTCCGGILKPNVIFFGDNVPKEWALAAERAVTGADALLVVGSSLSTLSAFRLARLAADRGSPIAILNVGETRADPLASLKVQARCGEVLARLSVYGVMDVPRV